LIESPTFKSKKIEVLPGERLSYQSHKHRDELRSIVDGMAKVTIDGEDKVLNYGDFIFIKAGQKHRIQNI
jgi:mannose-6-phosphate isomerase-like protein (cupin superfamily)